MLCQLQAKKTKVILAEGSNGGKGPRARVVTIMSLQSDHIVSFAYGHIKNNDQWSNQTLAY